MKKRILSLMLCALMLLSAASCSSGTENAADDAAEAVQTEDTAVEISAAVEEETELLPVLPEKDYEGADFNMFLRAGTDWMADMYSEELTGEAMNDAIFTRNLHVSEQFNVNFAVINGSDDYGLDIKSDIIAGDDTYDILIPHGRFTFPYALEGLLLDWNKLEYVNLDNPWWNEDARHEFSVAHHLFAMTGDISYQNLGKTMAIFFNKRIVNDHNMTSPYELVLNGEWTLDKMIEMSGIGAVDLNGDGTMNVADDCFGYGTSPWGGPIQALYSTNGRIAGKDENDNLILTLYTEDAVGVYEKYFTFTDGASANISYDDYAAMFRESRLLFLDSAVGSYSKLRDMDDDFGIIPWPKYTTETDGYHSIVDAGCNLISVPITCKDAERASVILESLAYWGYKEVIPEYYDVVLTSKYARDPESTDMLDIIRAGRVLDIGYYFFSNSTDLNSAGFLLSEDASHNFASLYKKYEKIVTKQYENASKTIVKYYGE